MPSLSWASVVAAYRPAAQNSTRYNYSLASGPIVADPNWTHGTTIAPILKVPRWVGEGEQRRRVWLQPARMQVLRITCLLEKDDYGGDRPATCLAAEDALASYADFPVLYQEQRNARNYPFNGSFRLFDLPPEIRNIIFRQWLVRNDPMDLAMSRFPYWPDEDDDLEYFLDLSYTGDRSLLYDVPPLLRLCRQGNEEMRGIFYGENTFRFFDRESWTLLTGFMHTIGNLNAGHLRRITISVPWANNSGSGVYPSDTVWRTGKDDEFGACVKFPDSYCGTLQDDFQRSMQSLIQAQNLTEPNLMLPFSCYVTNVWSIEDELSQLPYGQVKVTLVHVRGSHTVDLEPNKSQRPLLQHDREVIRRGKGRKKLVEYVTEFVSARAYAKEHGWDYVVRQQDQWRHWDNQPDFEEVYPTWVDVHENENNNAPPALRKFVRSRHIL